MRSCNAWHAQVFACAQTEEIQHLLTHLRLHLGLQAANLRQVCKMMTMNQMILNANVANGCRG